MPDASASPSVVIFDVADHRLALPAATVRRVLPLPRLEPLPASPPVIAGVFRYGSAVVPVLHVDRLLGLPASPPNLYRPLLLTQRTGGMLALLCDRVIGLLQAHGLGIIPDGGEFSPLSFNHCTTGRFDQDGVACFLLDPCRFLTAIEERLLDDLRTIAGERLAVWGETAS